VAHSSPRVARTFALFAKAGDVQSPQSSWCPRCRERFSRAHLGKTPIYTAARGLLGLGFGAKTEMS
jgi:hypothetical protein